MTVSSTSSRVVYVGDGVTTAWPFAFKIGSSSDIAAVYSDATGTDHTLSYGSQYTATGFGADMGGTVSYPLSGSPIAPGTRLTIYRNVAVTQPTSISNQGAMWPQVIEAALDRLTYIAQKLSDSISRALVISPTDSLALGELPSATSRANALLGFDPSGQPVAVQFSTTAIAWATWLVNNFATQATSAVNACAALGAFFLTGNNAPSGNMTPSAGTWNLTGASVTVATAAAGTNTTQAASAAFVQAAVAARTAVADANVTPTDTSRAIAFTSLSAARQVLLPAANTMTAGRTIDILDGSGSASATNTISLVPNGTDTIAGSNTTQVAINVPRGRTRLVCNGANGWDVEIWSVIIAASLGSDQAMDNNITYKDGPSAAQGSVGLWEASGQVTLLSTSSDNFAVKLWDGTGAAVDAAFINCAANQSVVCALSGIVSAPAGNIRLSAKNTSSSNGSLKFNQSGNGNKDCTLTVKRIA
jgi:hypothetical protein